MHPNGIISLVKFQPQNMSDIALKLETKKFLTKISVKFGEGGGSNVLLVVGGNEGCGESIKSFILGCFLGYGF